MMKKVLGILQTRKISWMSIVSYTVCCWAIFQMIRLSGQNRIEGNHEFITENHVVTTNESRGNAIPRHSHHDAKGAAVMIFSSFIESLE
jgi:hypothetical protein